MKTLDAVLFAAALSLPAAALAHGEKIGPNGGVVEDAGKHHIELVMKADELRAFVTDAKDAKVDTKGAEATAVVLAGKAKATLKLAPVGGNVLAAGGKFDTGARAKVVVSLTLQGQPAAQARFTLPARK